MSEVAVETPTATQLRKQYNYVWKAGSGSKLTRGMLELVLSDYATKIMASSLSLRIQAHLLLGLVRIYQYMVQKFSKDLSSAKKAIVEWYVTERPAMRGTSGAGVEEAPSGPSSPRTTSTAASRAGSAVKADSGAANVRSIQNSSFDAMLDDLNYNPATINDTLSPSMQASFEAGITSALDAALEHSADFELDQQQISPFGRPSIGRVEAVREALAFTPDQVDQSLRQGTPLLGDGQHELDLSFLTSPVAGEKQDLMNLTRKLDLSLLTPAQMMSFLEAAPSPIVPSSVVRQPRQRRARNAAQPPRSSAISSRDTQWDSATIQQLSSLYDEAIAHTDLHPYREVDPLLRQIMQTNERIQDKKCKFMSMLQSSSLSGVSFTFPALSSEYTELVGDRLERFDRGRVEEEEEKEVIEPVAADNMLDESNYLDLAAPDVFAPMELDESLLGLLDTSDLQGQSPLERSGPPSPLSSEATPLSAPSSNKRVLAELEGIKKRVRLSDVVDDVSSDILVQIDSITNPSDPEARKLYAKRRLYAARTFIAMLTQLCEQKIEIEQEAPYKDIFISSK